MVKSQNFVEEASVDSVRTGGSEEMALGLEPKCRVLRTSQQVEEIRPFWAAMPGHRDSDIDVYQTVLNCTGGTSAAPYVIVVEQGEQPSAIMVGSVTESTLREKIAYWTIPISNVRILHFQYGGFLGSQSPENSKLMIDQVRRSLQSGEADVAILNSVHEDSPLRQFATNISSVLMRGHVPAPALHAHFMMEMPTTADGVYGVISGDHRKKIRAEAKKFRAAFPDLKMVRFESTEKLEQLVKDTEAVAATTYQRGLGVGFSDTPAIRELLALEARKGWLRGYVLYADNRPCAFWIGCIYGGVFLSEYLGHDPSYARHSPGTYLFIEAVEGLRSEGVSAVDFGVGEAFYKKRFATKSWKEGTLFLYAPRWSGLRVKTVATVAASVNHVGKLVLERWNLVDRLKKLWRKRVTRKAAGAAQ